MLKRPTKPATRRASAKSDLVKKLEAAQGRTDEINIGLPMPSHANPLFAWGVQQYVAGNTSAMNGELGRLSKEERQLLSRIKKTPAISSTLLDQFQSGLSAAEQEAFADLLATMQTGLDPTSVATMADARKVVSGTKWLWRSLLPYAMLTEIMGPPGFGKSGLALGGFVEPIILGRNWPDGSQGLGTWNYVCWCDTEASMAITLDRIEQWKLPAERILLPFPEDVLKSVQLENAEHLQRLHNLINLKRPHLLVIDSLRGSHKLDENSSRVSQVLESLADLAQRTKIAIIVIHHTKKMYDDEQITANSSRGSNAIIALVRCQIGLDRPDPKSDWTRFQVLKENMGMKPQPQGFRFGKHGLEFGPAPEMPSRTTKLDEAEKFLRERMEAGKPYKSGEMIALADEFCISKRTLQRAATERLGIQPEAKTENGNLTYYWQLKGAN